VHLRVDLGRFAILAQLTKRNRCSAATTHQRPIDRRDSPKFAAGTAMK
jgi:hypothetical protein